MIIHCIVEHYTIIQKNCYSNKHCILQLGSNSNFLSFYRFERHDQHTLIYTFMNPFSIMLNAAINPVIYFIRIQKVRKDFIKSVKKPKELLINCVKGNQDTAV